MNRNIHFSWILLDNAQVWWMVYRCVAKGVSQLLHTNFTVQVWSVFHVHVLINVQRTHSFKFIISYLKKAFSCALVLENWWWDLLPNLFWYYSKQTFSNTNLKFIIYRIGYKIQDNTTFSEIIKCWIKDFILLFSSFV